jgi:hypothetical protein
MQTNELKRARMRTNKHTKTHKQVGTSTTERVQMNSRTSANGHEHADKGAQTSANKQVAGTSMSEHR